MNGTRLGYSLSGAKFQAPNSKFQKNPKSKANGKRRFDDFGLLALICVL
jgi:hypothetical protein